VSRSARAAPDPLGLFHPAVASWFREAFPGGPTEAQRLAWPAIASGEDVLLVSPTGTGKTLAAFLVALDGILRRRLAGDDAPRLATLYVSPLKALDNDVHRNLERPRAGIAAQLGAGRVPVTTAGRTGDTPAPERTSQLKAPPDVLITTAESVYLMLTGGGRRALEGGLDRRPRRGPFRRGDEAREPPRPLARAARGGDRAGRRRRAAARRPLGDGRARRRRRRVRRRGRAGG